MTTRERIPPTMLRFFRKHDRWPTVRELGALVGLKSTSTTHHHLSMLEAQGKVGHRIGNGHSRGYFTLIPAGECPTCHQALYEERTG